MLLEFIREILAEEVGSGESIIEELSVASDLLQERGFGTSRLGHDLRISRHNVFVGVISFLEDDSIWVLDYLYGTQDEPALSNEKYDNITHKRDPHKTAVDAAQHLIDVFDSGNLMFYHSGGVASKFD